MFKLNKKAYEGNATQQNIKDIVKTIGTITNTMSKVILQNKKDIKDLQARIKEIEDTFIIKEDK
jgi:glucosamine 6-phosphate synthetase-like amidotransferase/phosphosugar isomerase protein